MADDKTDLKKLGNIIMPSTHQLSKEICKMLEKRGKAQPAANPKDAQTCFVDDELSRKSRISVSTFFLLHLHLR